VRCPPIPILGRFETKPAAFPNLNLELPLGDRRSNRARWRQCASMHRSRVARLCRLVEPYRTRTTPSIRAGALRSCRAATLSQSRRLGTGPARVILLPSGRTVRRTAFGRAW
jgi:hypothetical protein